VRGRGKSAPAPASAGRLSRTWNVALVAYIDSPPTEDTIRGTRDGFTEAGQYRVVVYAQDSTGNQASPEVVMVTVGGEHEVYLPLVMKRF